eukprot:4079334-Alexandrium_andersonii.AAC.1
MHCLNPKCTALPNMLVPHAVKAWMSSRWALPGKPQWGPSQVRSLNICSCLLYTSPSPRD